MTDTPQSRTYVLTFTDLVYAALAAYGLELTATALDHHDYWAVAYLGAGGVWMFYDWYANHYFASDEDLGAKNLPIDFVGLILYAGLLYASSKTSAWLFVFLAIRGLRGIVHNEMTLRYGTGRHDVERRRSYNYSSGFMVATYIPLFLYDKYFRPWDVGGRFGVAVGIWLIAYGIALLVEARLDRRVATRLPEETRAVTFPRDDVQGRVADAPSGGGLLRAVCEGLILVIVVRAFAKALRERGQKW